MSNSKQEIVVYKHSSTGGKADVVIMTKDQLQDTMAKDPSLRVSRKPIPRGHRHVEIFQLDIMAEAKRAAHAHYPNMGSSVASVTLPNRVWMQRQLTADQFSELHILSV